MSVGKSEVGKKAEKKTEKKLALESALEKLERITQEITKDIESLEEIAEKLKEIREREKELVNGGQFLMERIEKRISILDVLGVVDNELMEKIENFKAIFNVRAKARANTRTRVGRTRGKRVFVDGKEFASAAEACRYLEIDYGMDSPVRALKRWAKANDRAVIEKGDEIIIE